MNTHDKYELPPLPEWMSNYTIPADGFEYDKNVMLVDRMHDYARAAIEADRKRHDRMLAHEWIRPALDLPENAPYRFDYYAQEIERLRNDRKRRGEPVAWVAADTLNSPHPGCVSSLAYMSQLDKDRGREYVPLYAAPVAAQKADELAECRSAVADEVLALLGRSLAVIQHDIDEIGGCDHSVGICCCELIHLADDIRAAMQRSSGGDDE